MSTARAAALLLIGAMPIAAQEPLSSAGSRDVAWPLPRLQGEIQVDGRSDDPAWQAVAPLPMAVYLPAYGARPTERTEARIGYDADAIYVMVDAWEGHEGGVRASSMIRDDDSPGDFLNLTLDTFGDRQNAVTFSTTPGGQRNDWTVSNDARDDAALNPAWNGVWDLAVRREPDGWHAEYRIPFTTLRFTTRNGRAELGLSINRLTAHSNERVTFPAIEPSAPLALWKPSRWQRVSVEDITTARSLRVMPYVMAGSEGTRAPDPMLSPWRRDERVEVGGDIKTALSPNLTLDLTVNTDFAEAEVDDQRVNLTRFPLRFPERRDFFLEGSGVFDFAPGNGVEPYFSRRIGLVSGTPVPIRYGTRLTGQAGAYDLGFVQVRTGVEEGLPAENFTVARVVRNLFQQSSVGMIYTRRSTGEEEDAPLLPDRHTLGTDLNLSTSRFLGDRNLRFQAFYVWHSDPTPEGGATWSQRTARGIRLSYPNDLWSGHISYRELGESFDPPVGFTPRRGFRRVQPSLQYSPRPEWWPQVRQLDFGISGEYLADLSGQLQTGSIGLDVLGIRFESGDQISLEYDTSFERLEREFRLHPDTARRTLIPAGDYSFGGWEINASTAGRRPVSAGFAFSRGAFWSGRRNQLGASVTVRPLAGVNLSAGAEQNAVRLPEEEFTTRLMRVGAGWHLNPATSLTGNLQYDNVSEVAGLYTRLRWIIRPGSDLFVVYTHNWQNVIGGFDTLQRGATTKLSYTHRF